MMWFSFPPMVVSQQFLNLWFNVQQCEHIKHKHSLYNAVYHAAWFLSCISDWVV